MWTKTNDEVTCMEWVSLGLEGRMLTASNAIYKICRQISNNDTTMEMARMSFKITF